MNGYNGIKCFKWGQMDSRGPMHHNFRGLEFHIELLLVKYNEKQYRAFEYRAFFMYLREKELVQISQVTCLLLN